MYRVEVSCDGCGVGWIWEERTAARGTVVRLARGKGWQVGKTGWFCPDCRKKRRDREGEHYGNQKE